MKTISLCSKLDWKSELCFGRVKLEALVSYNQGQIIITIARFLGISFDIINSIWFFVDAIFERKRLDVSQLHAPVQTVYVINMRSEIPATKKPNYN